MAQYNALQGEVNQRVEILLRPRCYRGPTPTGATDARPDPRTHPGLGARRARALQDGGPDSIPTPDEMRYLTDLTFKLVPTIRVLEKYAETLTGKPVLN